MPCMTRECMAACARQSALVIVYINYYAVSCMTRECMAACMCPPVCTGYELPGCNHLCMFTSNVHCMCWLNLVPAGVDFVFCSEYTFEVDPHWIECVKRYWNQPIDRSIKQDRKLSFNWKVFINIFMLYRTNISLEISVILKEIRRLNLNYEKPPPPQL